MSERSSTTRVSGRNPRSLVRKSAQAGFTLIELMISLLVAAILVAMAFSVYTQLSVAYRSQSEVSELQQTLRAAKLHISKHVRAAGHLIPNGFALNGQVELVPGLSVVNDDVPAENTFSPDRLTVFYADASAIAVINDRIPASPNTNTVEVDNAEDFTLDDLAFIVNPRAAPVTTAGQAPIVGYDACLVKITNITLGSPGSIQFDGSGAPFNTSQNQHCDTALDLSRSPVMYRAMARSFRIAPDLTDRRKGLLQMSPTGGLVADDWQIIGVGFTNLQLAVRYFEEGDGVDADALDTDPERDWYSGVTAPPVGAVPIEVTLSLELRPTHNLDVVPTATTPSFIEENGDVDHNRIGDWASVTLAGVDDAARPEQYRGNHIYRWSTTRIDVRNLGVGR